MCLGHLERERLAAWSIDDCFALDHEDYDPRVSERRVEVEAEEARRRREAAFAAIDTTRWEVPDGSRYGLRALANIMARLRDEGENGGRNNALNRAAFACGQLVAGGELAEFRALDTLTFCAEALRLPKREHESTIKRGLRDGLDHPLRPRDRSAA